MTKQFTHTWEEAVLWLKAQPDKKEVVRSCYYDDPITDVAKRFVASEEWAALLNILGTNPPGKVLDLGAGRGISSYAFAQAGWEVTSLEPNPSDVVGAGSIKKLADESGLKIEVVGEYAETLSFVDEMFDVVYGRAVMHHAQDLSQFCREAARVLKPGGMFIATREHVLSKKEDLQVFLDGHLLHHLYGGENAYLLSDYLGAIQSGGLILRKVLAPYDSAINYGPQTTEEMYKLLGLRLGKVVGNSLGCWLVGNEFIRKSFRWYAAIFLRFPGRSYSFLAVKK
jgi:2-polyprenyl-3-methyl-5-hydroxy-6-metoxy-1,4-benzoquinol methylase